MYAKTWVLATAGITNKWQDNIDKVEKAGGSVIILFTMYVINSNQSLLSTENFPCSDHISASVSPILTGNDTQNDLPPLNLSTSFGDITPCMSPVTPNGSISDGTSNDTLFSFSPGSSQYQDHLPCFADPDIIASDSQRLDFDNNLQTRNSTSSIIMYPLQSSGEDVACSSPEDNSYFCWNGNSYYNNTIVKPQEITPPYLEMMKRQVAACFCDLSISPLINQVHANRERISSILCDPSPRARWGKDGDLVGELCKTLQDRFGNGLTSVLSVENIAEYLMDTEFTAIICRNKAKQRLCDRMRHYLADKKNRRRNN